MPPDLSGAAEQARGPEQGLILVRLRALILRQQARARTKQLALSVLRLPRHLEIRYPCRNPRWGRRIARRVAC